MLVQLLALSLAPGCRVAPSAAVPPIGAGCVARHQACIMSASDPDVEDGAATLSEDEGVTVEPVAELTSDTTGTVVPAPDPVSPAKRKADAQSNARLVDALFGSIEEEESKMDKDVSLPSHKQLDLDADGKPLLMRFAYVDEQECIGCTYCASVARNTFTMEPDAGRARAYAQGVDDPETVMEAIACCPVNCISFVDHEDLVILESERDGQMINQRMSGLKGVADSHASRLPPTKAKMGGSTMVCNSCPTRGCK